MWKIVIEIIKKLVNGSTDERREKTTTLVVGGGGLWQELPVDLVFELCLRLPIHKLFQFMCVSNRWRSIISQPNFSKAYYSRNCSRVLLLSLKEHDGDSYKPRFYHSLLGEQWVRSPLKIDHLEFTQVINGLVCAYSSLGLPCCFLCNIFTGEFMRISDSGDEDVNSRIRYYFSFDPVNRLYKLLRLITYKSKPPSCEILTLFTGNSTWRKLDHLPENVASDYLYCRSVVIRGVVYFVHDPSQVNSFNFTEEKFHSVPLPAGKCFCFFEVTQSRGRLTLLGAKSCNKITVYVLNDKEGYSWTSHETILPMEVSAWRNTFPVGSLPTGEILLMFVTKSSSKVLVDGEPGESFTNTTLYSCDFEKNNFKKFLVGKLPQSIVGRKQNIRYVISCVEPNYGTMDALIPSIRGDGCSRYLMDMLGLFQDFI